MSVCCVSGCVNRHSSKSKLKFARIPSGKSPFQVNRRKLWLRAIHEANPSSKRLSRNARICGAHFISGEVSLVHDNVDFIPSVFKCIKRSPKKNVTRFMSSFFGRRKRRRHKKDAGEEEMKTPPEADPVDEQSPVLMETESELSQELEAPSTPSVAKEAETLTEMAEAEKGAGTITSQTTSSPNKTSPSVPAGSPDLDKRNPVVLLKPLILQAGGYRFHLCSQNLTTAAQPVKEEPLDGEEKPCSCGICGMQFTNQTGFTQHQCVKPEMPSFPCNICDRSFTSYHCLKRHKLLHVKDGRKCGKCGVLFCRRHNHTPFHPATEFREESSSGELQTEGSNVTPENGVQQKSDQSWTYGTQSTKTVKPWRRNATIVPKPPPPTNTVPTPPPPTNTVPTPPPTTITVPTPSHTTTTVPKAPVTTFVLTRPITPTTVPTPSHTATTLITSPITAIVLRAPTTTTTTTTVPTPSHSTTTVPTPPNPQPLSKTHKFTPPAPGKRVRPKKNPAPSSASCPPPPVPGCSSNPDTSAEAVRPPQLPSSLKIFSPQYLTSALLQVTRNYEYILSKSKADVKFIKEEPSERPISPVEEIVEPVPNGRIAYDLEIVV
ncbi:zinc finger protein ztf-16-like [Hippoglossus stenolepis]|uniref:zinc finger protein ztf-16-like n=1 Tax=Hippoglossus stenolepis TaxID=195615 RepID=UPI001FAEDF7F|nr:zinc finger protein ztf-16-like [Hippoglossus stenolepis]